MLTATLFKSMMELIMTNVRSSNTLGNNINIQSLHHDVQFLVLKGKPFNSGHCEFQILKGTFGFSFG